MCNFLINNLLNVTWRYYIYTWQREGGIYLYYLAHKYIIYGFSSLYYRASAVKIGVERNLKDRETQSKEGDILDIHSYNS